MDLIAVEVLQTTIEEKILEKGDIKGLN